MGKKCFVPNCRSGYASCSENVSLFSPPLDCDKLKTWIKNIPRDDKILTRNDRVCAKHFDPKFIIREWSNGMITIPLDMPRLSKEAIPTIFPGCPSYLNIKNKSRRPLIRDNVMAAQPCKRRKKSESCVVGVDAEYNNKGNEPNTSDNKVLIFEELWKNSCCSIKLPNELWSSHKVCTADGSRCISFSKMFIAKDSGLPNIERQVVIDVNFEPRAVIKGLEVELPETSHSFEHQMCVKSLGDIILQVNNMNICPGGPTFNKYVPTSTYSESAVPDHTVQIWRHNKCPILQTSLQSCNFCHTLKNTMRLAKNRKCKATLKVRTKTLLLDKSQLGNLRKLNNKQKRISVRAKKRIGTLQKEVLEIKNKMKAMKAEKLEDYLRQHNLPEQQKILIKECVNISKFSCKNGRRYSNDWLLYCLLLHIRSPSTYQFLMYNDILPLPSPTTIRRYLARVDMKCGLDQSFFKALRLKLSQKNKFQRHGVLLFDEMQVRKSIKVNTKTMELTGIVDFGDDLDDNNMSYELADHALVFMFCPIVDNYAQPVAVYAAKGATKGTILASLIIKVIQELEKIGAAVDGIICDGASTNRRMWKEFGVSGIIENPSNKCVHPVDEKRNLFFFSDTPHLFKCIRNKIYQKGYIKLPNGKVQWKHYEAVYKEDLKLSGNLKVCPKISYNHIYPSPLLKMRVKLATQIFSNAMTDGLIFYKQKNLEQLKEAEITILITKKLNDLFDSLNRKVAKEGIKLGSSDMKIIEDGLEWLNNWEKYLQNKSINNQEFLSKSTAEGLRVTLLSTLEIIKYLIAKQGFRYILTNKFNQDPLEQFFGTIRQAGGSNDHPSFSSFIQLYRMLSVYKLIKPPRFGNCTVEKDATEHLNFKNFKMIFQPKTINHVHNIENKLTEVSTLLDEEDHEELLDLLISTSIVSDSVLYYIGGFFVRKIKKTTTCSDCIKGLSTNNTFENVAIADLTNLKTRGFLTHPTVEMYYLFKIAECCFLKHLNSKYMYEETVADCINSIDFKFPCELHKLNVISHALHHFVLMRMRQYFQGEETKVKSNFKEKNKMSKLQTN